jgi:uncharacterized circularly permuted ATP-grasp superfamily protein/uncharacterized alpha-E superfamily protein
MIGELYQSPLRYGGTYDESSVDGITPRPHWAELMELLRTLGPEELDHRWSRAERRIRENGITYNIYGDPEGANRPWKIDLVPLLIPDDEWRRIEAGIIQRAELLNLLLQDLYGPQDLLRNGQIPAALLYANPAFLRPMVGVKVPAQSYLHMMAIDLARSPDGSWWVLANRTQAPSGSGYALENRILVSDLLPELFRTANVQRLAPFFRAQRDALTQLSGRDNPRIVLLTPGPHNETYFEHSYLAKYLGFTLVEGADLTVRERRVYLKTVGGLEQVDVILRRVDDDFCDPLEFRGDSLLGVSGLVEAVVAGNVRVANALGSGVVESSAIMPFLPALSKHLLGEELKLPSVATWWCGQEPALNWVLDNLESVVVKPAFASVDMEPMFGSEMSAANREKLRARLRERPHDFVAQEQVSLSTAPVWEPASENAGLSSRSIVLRTYVLNTGLNNGKGWIAIPGGLVRVAEAGGSIVSMQRGGHSKDAWVLSDTPVNTFSLLRPRDEPLKLRRVSLVVPSSVADNTFWLGRYVERAECQARILRAMIPRVYLAGGVSADAELGSLRCLHRCIATRHSKLPKRSLPTSAAFEKELLAMLTDKDRPDSLPATLAEVARIGGNVRERLSADMMLLINQLRGSIHAEVGLDLGIQLSDYSPMLTGCLELLSAFSGMERENINRGLGWVFMSIGRRLERAIYQTRELRQITRPLAVEDWVYLERLLEVADSSMTYRARYYTTLQPLAVLDVLMADETNPRSLDFQLNHLVELYGKLPRHLDADLKAMQDALASLRRIDLQAMTFPAFPTFPQSPSAGRKIHGRTARRLAAQRNDPFTQLDQFLAELEELLPSWSNNLSSHYFSHARTLPITMGND